ncbi:Pantothenate kinase type III, CoaX-like [hydrothermal vent metagenome]|uniref:Type III pantothenate kinase n=1 Tax=hydrothermal vent metagenome TaxID=652676 RepID=A0A3B0WTM1_9ZZZZ
MILTIDIGNSRIKVASWQSDKIIARAVVAYSVNDLLNDFDKLFSEWVLSDELPSHVYVVNVAGSEISQALMVWIRQHWQLEICFLKTEKQYKDVINAYDDPAQHGVDRWAGVVAGHQCFSDFSVCVISAGTAITFDFINKNGQHLGGYILPSYNTMHAALLADAMNVAAVFDVQNYKCNVKGSIPNNTNDAVNQGLHKFIQAGVREFCQLAKDKMDAPVKIIITGGFAKTILTYPDMPVMHHEPDLVMQGLYDVMKYYER